MPRRSPIRLLLDSCSQYIATDYACGFQAHIPKRGNRLSIRVVRSTTLDHKSDRMTTHYSAPDIARLIDATEKVCIRQPNTVLRIVPHANLTQPALRLAFWLPSEFPSAYAQDPAFEAASAQLRQAEGWLEVVVERATSVHLTEPGGYTEGILLIGRSVVPRKASAEERRVNFGNNSWAISASKNRFCHDSVSFGVNRKPIPARSPATRLGSSLRFDRRLYSLLR